MSPLQALLLPLIFICSSQAQDGAVQSTTAGSQVLQPWLVGLTAVVVFLFIVFLLMIVNRVWCYKKHSSDEELQELDKSRSIPNTYDNLTLEEEDKEEEKEEKRANKTTSL